MREFAIKVRYVVDQINYVMADTATEAMGLCKAGTSADLRDDGKGIVGFSDWSEGSTRHSPTFRHLKEGKDNG